MASSNAKQLYTMESSDILTCLKAVLWSLIVATLAPRAAVMKSRNREYFIDFNSSGIDALTEVPNLLAIEKWITSLHFSNQEGVITKTEDVKTF